MTTRAKVMRMVLRRGTPPPPPPAPQPPITDVTELEHGAAVLYTDQDGKPLAVHVTVVVQRGVLVGYGQGSWNAMVTNDDLGAGRVTLHRR